MRSTARRTTLAALTLIPTFFFAGCGETKERQVDVCHLPDSVVSAAFGDAHVETSSLEGEFPVGPHDDNGLVSCSARVEDEVSFEVTASLQSTGKVDARAREIAKGDLIRVRDLPVGYHEDATSFEAQAVCGMVFTVVRGPVVDGATARARKALVADVVTKAGCRRLTDVPRIPQPLQEAVGG